MDFKDWFCLKGRDSFTIDAQINTDDAQFYFGREEKRKELKKQVSKGFIDPGVPKIFIYGSYGCGKTQTLYHMEYDLKNEPPRSLKLKPYIVHLVVEMGSKSNHLDWHLQIMEALGKETVVRWIDSLFSQAPNIDQALEQLFGDYNFTNAAKNLRGGGEMPLLAWRWLAGHRLSSAELQRLQLTRNAGDTGARDLVNVLLGLGRLAETNGEKLIFFMDELEQFINISNPDAMENVHNYLRQLAEPKNSTVGFLMSTWGVTADEVPPILRRADIISRIGAINYIEIPPLPTVDDVRTFLTELLRKFIDQKAAEKRIQKEGLGVSLNTYPLDAEAFDLLCEYATQDPTKTVPRNILRCLNECAISAWDEEKMVIDTAIVNDTAPLVFME